MKRILPAGAVLTLLAVLLWQLDVRDGFHHGYFTDARPFENVADDSILGSYDLSEGAFSLTFTPAKDHFAGFVLYVTDLPEDAQGSLVLQVEDSEGTPLDTVDVALSEMVSEHAYKVQREEELCRGESYLLTISIRDCETAPSLILVDEDFRAEESADNGLLIGYAYAESTFTAVEKCLLSLLAIGLTLCLLTAMYGSCGGKRQRAAGRIGFGLILLILMAWNDSFSTLNGNNDTFEGFQSDSEALVTDAITARREGIANPAGTGLLRLYTLSGTDGSEEEFLTEGDWVNGYHTSDPAISLRSSAYTEAYVIPGNYIRFANGEEHEILSTGTIDSEWMVAALDIDAPIDADRLGDLAEATVLDAQGNPLPETAADAYFSQYGLQGKVFQRLSMWIEDVDVLRLLCALGTAATLLLVSCLVGRKYNRRMGVIFYLVFLLSPWVVNFANNLYWVEFTWFLPMAAGLWCSLHRKVRRWRMISYLLMFLAVMIKCLCGYEYVTSVMLGGILFLLADLVEALRERNRQLIRSVFLTILFMGIAALLGFAAAMCLHAPLKSGGSVLTGLRMIVEQDALRRTYGADLNQYDNLPYFGQYALTASAWETLCKYFHFKTEIIAGVDGSLFPLLVLASLGCLLLRRRKQVVTRELCTDDSRVLPALYCISFITSVSWFVLAKSHSCVHTHMNYVLWYFGFVQVCFYILLDAAEAWICGLRRA